MYEIKIRLDKGGKMKTEKDLVEYEGDIAEVAGLIKKYYGNLKAEILAIYLSAVKEVYGYDKVTDQPLKWFNAKLQSYEVSESTGENKGLAYNVLVQAKDFDDATERTKEFLKMGYDMELTSIAPSGIKYFITSEELLQGKSE